MTECCDFLFFSRYGSSLIYYSTHAHGKMKFICFIHQKCSETLCFVVVSSSVIYTLIAHAQEPMKLLHLYELLYKL